MTLDEAVTFRDAAKSAYLDALAARSVETGDRSVSRQEIAALRRELDSWERVVADLQRISIGAAYPAVAIATWKR